MIHCLLIKITNEKDHPNHNGGSKLTFPYTKRERPICDLAFTTTCNYLALQLNFCPPTTNVTSC